MAFISRVYCINLLYPSYAVDIKKATIINSTVHSGTIKMSLQLNKHYPLILNLQQELNQSTVSSAGFVKGDHK